MEQFGVELRERGRILSNSWPRRPRSSTWSHGVNPQTWTNVFPAECLHTRHPVATAGEGLFSSPRSWPFHILSFPFSPVDRTLEEKPGPFPSAAQDVWCFVNRRTKKRARLISRLWSGSFVSYCWFGTVSVVLGQVRSIVFGMFRSFKVTFFKKCFLRMTSWPRSASFFQQFGVETHLGTRSVYCHWRICSV